MSKLYGYPEMGRTGLGHSLLAWARCLVWCERHGAEMIAPLWLRIRVGPYLRGERDKREYFKLFTSGGMIRWPKRSLILGSSQKIRSTDGYFDQDIHSQAYLDKLRTGNRNYVVVFDNALANNEVKFSADVYGHSDLLRKRFLRMIRPRFLLKNFDSGSIAIHVRMGVLIVKSAEELVSDNTRLPVEWYGAALSELRNRLGVSVPAIDYAFGFAC